MRFDEIYFLEVEHVHELHADTIALGGGDPGILDEGLIESAVMAPRSGYYNSLAELAAAYAYGLANNHGFRDGNKRTAFFAMAAFLGMNGFTVEPGPNWVAIMVGVADGSVSREALTGEIVRLMGSDVDIDP